MYSQRFSREAERRNHVWRELTPYFQRWIPVDSTVLEVAAGRGEFINNIKAGHKIAIDLNPDLRKYVSNDVDAYVAPSTDLSMVADKSIDVVFVSNFFEHISRVDILRTLAEIRRVLHPQGRILVLQPNIRFCQRDYWMFFDHITAIDDRSLAEALAVSGFAIEKLVVRFLPYTMKRRLPSAPWLVRLYLRVPLAWRILGAQTFVVARIKPPMPPETLHE
jgi:ubiquinone/menaquinone biosynthesis C-methylase UbiE